MHLWIELFCLEGEVSSFAGENETLPERKGRRRKEEGRKEEGGRRRRGQGRRRGGQGGQVVDAADGNSIIFIHIRTVFALQEEDFVLSNLGSDRERKGDANLPINGCHRQNSYNKGQDKIR
jgi:hypothetical protein